MTTLLKVVVVCVVLCHAPIFAQQSLHTVDGQGHITIQDLKFSVPAGWKLHQDAFSAGTMILGFEKGTDYLTIYVDPSAGTDMKSMFANGADVMKEVSQEQHGPITWQVIQTKKTLKQGPTYYVKGFMSQFNGHVYVGYNRSQNAADAVTGADGFLAEVAVPLKTRSLTGQDYKGKKYYLGWGAAGFGDPELMQNEVKYDVLHTHDIFTKDVGGDYIGKTLIGPSTTSSQIRNEWKRLGTLLTADDMYLQYSSGHGSPSGLGVGLRYGEIRDNALAYPAKEIIIFTMACYSGNLVDSFDAKKSVWQDWQSKGRTLMVMTSSSNSETSSTGPGTDPDQAGGPDGSAGSAFGHSLWKALIGYADGYVDGVKDGFLSLGEIRDFTMNKTQEVGGHTPVSTGAYNPGLIMNRKPSKEFVDSLENGTEGLSDDQIVQRIQELDRSMRVQ